MICCRGNVNVSPSVGNYMMACWQIAAIEHNGPVTTVLLGATTMITLVMLYSHLNMRNISKWCEIQHILNEVENDLFMCSESFQTGGLVFERVYDPQGLNVRLLCPICIHLDRLWRQTTRIWGLHTSLQSWLPRQGLRFLNSAINEP